MSDEWMIQGQWLFTGINVQEGTVEAGQADVALAMLTRSGMIELDDISLAVSA